MENETCYTNRTWLYHPSGLKVEIGLPRGAAETIAAIDEYLALGFSVNPPDGSAGEKLEVRFVVRGQRVDDDGAVVDRVYFYKDWGMEGSDMTVYFDDVEDTAKFERASGLQLASLPIWKSKAAPAKTSSDFSKFAKSVNFTVTREKRPSKKYPEGRWIVIDYVWAKGGAITPSSTPKTGQGSTTGDESEDIPPTAKAKAIAWAKGKGYDTSRYPYGNGDPHSEVIAKAWCEAIFKQQGNVEATG